MENRKRGTNDTSSGHPSGAESTENCETVINRIDCARRDESVREWEQRVTEQSNHSLQRSIEDLELGDIIDSQAIQSMMDDFYRFARIPISIIDLNGKVLVGVGRQDICTKFHRVHPETRTNCIESDLRLSAGIPKGEFRLYKCLNNIWDIATPLFVCGKHMGNVFSGQFLFDDEPIDYDLFRSQARRHGFDEDEYIAALESVPRLCRSDVEAGMSFFIKIADVISGASYDNIHLARSLVQRDALMASLQESRNDLNRAQAVAHTGSWRLDVRRNELTWSDETYRIFGIPEGTPLTYEDFLSAVHPGDREYVEREWSAALHDEPYQIEFRIVVGDTVKWVREKAELEFGKEGLLLGGFGTVQDITERKRSEEALKSSEEKYRHLVKHAPTGIYEVDYVNKRLKSVNDVMCQVLGYTEEELLCMNPLDLLDEEGKRTLVERIMKSLAGEKVDETVEYGVIAKDGRKIWTVLNNAFTYEEGRITGALVVAYDINERKKAEETLRTNEAQLAKLNQIMAGILEHTHMLAVLLDSQFNFIWVNRAYAAACRHDPSFFPGKNHFDLYPNEENKLIFQRVVDTGEPFFVAAKSFEDTDQRERGMTYWDWSLVPVKDGAGRVSNLVFTLTEVTERIRAEEALRKAHNQLELRVKERTAELERKNQELQEFAFVASHDLAEPLRKIQTFGDLLKAKSADHLCEQERDYVSRMSGAAGRMQELLDALLRYSRIETQGRDPVPLKLEEIVRTVAADLEVAIKKIGAHVEIGMLPIITGDPYQWRQIFQNLIANAVKYHRSEVKTIIKIHGEENNGTDHLFVEDNGIGFDEKYLDKIFLPFQRLHGKHEYPGTGIGLAICKKIVERHGGMITAKSTPGKGSTFIITLHAHRIKAM
ncbi:MAG: hypothetical protein CVU57_07380 [Deltaproteobacteria bacterium HGW-Deltaproteobacteria-15]|jgi:PAS domain S-box-containing protein|nr:MAG: hypothetical protein CVU57_07380 [Deltaproteobacteria bacterium HGW-Deltaproteobacteria-15]